MVQNSPEKLSFLSPEFDHGTYAKVASLAKLQELRLLSANYKAVVEALFDGFSEKNAKFAYNGRKLGGELDDEKGFFLGSYSWSASVKVSRKVLVKASCEYLLVYGNLANQPKAYVDLYFDKIARFATYPYFRAQFAKDVASSGIFLPPLPSLTDRVD